MTNRLAGYNQRLTKLNDEISALKKKQKHLPMLRMALFLLFAFLLYRYLLFQTFSEGFFASASFLAFLILTIVDSRLKSRIRLLEIMVQINQKEIAALDGNFSPFDAGNEFIDQSHDYTHDLDIFGEGSLFQSINRTATIFGKLQIADYLSKAFQQSKQLVSRQEAVKELADMVELRQKLQLIFHGVQIAEADKTEMTQWLQSESPVGNLKLLRTLAYGLPAITLVCTVLVIAGFFAFPVFLVVLQLMIVFLYAKQTIKVQHIITSKSKILNKLAQCLHLIECTHFASDYLTGLQKSLADNKQQIPSKAIRQLSVILKYMDTNLNILVSVILNGLFMFNLHLLLKAEKWKVQHRQSVPIWFDAIATFDAMASLANFAYNHPEYCFPEPEPSDFRFIAENIGHPLLAHENCVVNNIEINGWNQFFIITGANMSGKSTFLRTIGVNLILAMAGAPVFATKLRFTPIEIHSSIRTSDSLTRHESYFYAELKRLKQIIDGLEGGKQKLILLDEILKGTNSNDKQAGSIALIEQLLRYRSVGLFATHDLMLGELQNRYPDHVNNLCFEIQISGDKMQIDYKLHEGVCKNLNATYLMKNMGILFEKD